MNPEDLERLHNACKMIEYDGVEAYHSCVERYGREVANILIISFLRRTLGGFPTFPEQKDIRKKVNDFLKESGILVETTDV